MKEVAQINADKQASHAAVSFEEKNLFGDESMQWMKWMYLWLQLG